MIRVGFGYDIHRLKPGRRLVLGGVEIPWDAGLDGFSDADVVLHAVMDALLGAAALGDIGRHFPPGDERYRNAASLDLLARVHELIAGAGYRVVNTDATVIAEQPRIGPHVEEMRRAIGGALHIAADQVSVKATTNEGLGPEGRMEGISAHAVAVLERIS